MWIKYDLCMSFSSTPCRFDSHLGKVYEKYFIFLFPRSGSETQRAFKFRNLTQNVSKIRGKEENGTVLTMNGVS